MNFVGQLIVQRIWMDGLRVASLHHPVCPTLNFIVMPKTFCYQELPDIDGRNGCRKLCGENE